MAKAKTVKVPLTTAQQLGSLIKSARDIMRKDKGLNGDIDRLPMLTWVMFLKFLDDLEHIHEQKAALAGKPYKPIIQAPYRWRDWAAKEDGISGDDLNALHQRPGNREAGWHEGQGAVRVPCANSVERTAARTSGM